MNSFEINKVLGALLGTCLVLVAMHIASGAIFTPETPAKPGYEIAVKEEQPPGRRGTGGAAEVPIENLLASASADSRRPSRQAMPSLPQLAGRAKAPRSAPISTAWSGARGRLRAGLQLFGRDEGKGGTWTFDDLNTCLTKPSAFVPGTAMTFAGLSNEKQRADVIAYLNTLSDNP